MAAFRHVVRPFARTAVLARVAAPETAPGAAQKAHLSAGLVFFSVVPLIIPSLANAPFYIHLRRKA
jgi:hypothetical protein